MGRDRKQYTSEEKAAILRRYLVDKVAASNLCDEYGMHPTQLYRWQKELFENAPAVFERSDGSREGKLEKTVDALREKLARKDEVPSEAVALMTTKANPEGAGSW